MTISRQAATSGASWVETLPTKLGQNASLVEAFRAVYRDPTLLPDRTTPPGNGVITPRTAAIASTDRFADASTASREVP